MCNQSGKLSLVEGRHSLAGSLAVGLRRHKYEASRPPSSARGAADPVVRVPHALRLNTGAEAGKCCDRVERLDCLGKLCNEPVCWRLLPSVSVLSAGRAGAAVEAGDVVSFDSYVQARSGGLLRLAWLITRDWEDARDAVQDALASVYPRWSRLPSGSGLDAYVSRCVVNACLAVLRGRKTRSMADVSVLDEAPVGATRPSGSCRLSSCCAGVASYRRCSERRWCCGSIAN